MDCQLKEAGTTLDKRGSIWHTISGSGGLGPALGDDILKAESDCAKAIRCNDKNFQDAGRG